MLRDRYDIGFCKLRIIQRDMLSIIDPKFFRPA